jgi:hypothetical protein
MPIFSSNTADPALLREIFDWGAKCTKNCKQKLTGLIERWPQGAKPAQLINPDATSYTGTDTKLGTYLARLQTDTANSNYELLVHVHNHDAIGAEIDPMKKWGKTLNMGGIPGIGIGARLTRLGSNVGYGATVGTAKTVGVGVGLVGKAAMCHATFGTGPGCYGQTFGSYGGRKTRRSRGKKSKRTRRR